MGDYLKKQDYLQTGEIRRVDLALMNDAQQRYSEVLFWQQEGSRSKFMPQAGTCHFQVDLGGFLYAHPHQGPGCEKIISKNALVVPNGTALFIIGSEHDTVVGVLSNRPNYAIKVQHLQSDKSVDLQAGEYAKAYDDGRLVKDTFDLKDFYHQNSLSLGLGPSVKDESYINRQWPDIQLILRKIRALPYFPW